MMFSLTIDDVVVDLFGDEVILLKRMLKDFRELDKLFSDFTQDFTIPATDKNNQVMRHFYMENAYSSDWNYSNALSAAIEYDGIPVFFGEIQLNSVLEKHGHPESYNITFYGQSKKAIVEWGQQLMSEVDWSEYDHILNISNIESSWSGGLFLGEVVYDIKDYHVGFTFVNNQGPATVTLPTIAGNISSGVGISIYDLRPSILLKVLVEKVFTKFGFTITGSTLLNRDDWDELYVTPMKTSGPAFEPNLNGNFNMLAESIGQTLSTTGIIFSNWFRLLVGNTVITDPSLSWSVANQEYTAQATGWYHFEIVMDVSGLSTGDLDIRVMIDKKAWHTWIGGRQTSWLSGGTTEIFGLAIYMSAGQKLYFEYQSSGGGTIDMSLEIYKSPTNAASVIFSELMPEMRIRDFINGVLRTYNAVIVPTSDTNFEIHAYSDYLNAGVQKDWTKYVDFDTVEKRKVPVPSEISFKHLDGNTAAHFKYRNDYGRDYGSLSYTPNLDFPSGEVLSIESIFHVNPMSIVPMVDIRGTYSGDTELKMPALIDDSGRPVIQQFALFYYGGTSAITNHKYYLDSVQRSILATGSPFSGGYANNTSDYSVCFAMESAISGNTPKNTIYYQYWHEYISRLYSTFSRIVVFTAYLPPEQWVNMKMNDTIWISGVPYKIMSIEYNLLTEQAKLELFTYPEIETLQIGSTTGKEINFNDPVESSGGKTFVYGDNAKARLFGARLYDGVRYVNELPDSNLLESRIYESISRNRHDRVYDVMRRAAMHRETPLNIELDSTGVDLVFEGVVWDSTEDIVSANIATGVFKYLSGGQVQVTVQMSYKGHTLLPFVGKIQVDGLDTEGYSQTNGSHYSSLYISAELTLNPDNEVTFNLSAATTHSIDIYKVVFNMRPIL